MTEKCHSVLVLSPHFDDAVMSCPGWILQRAREGACPLIASLFSHPGSAADSRLEEKYFRRQREGEKAASILGAKTLLSGFVDAPLRRLEYATFSGALRRRVREDETIVDGVCVHVDNLLEELRPQQLLAPLGVGQHIDHRITHQVACDVASRHPDIELIFYEDRPDSFVEEAVRFRLSQLGRNASVPDFDQVSIARRSERFFASYLSTPFVRPHLCRAEQSRIVVQHLESFVQSLYETITEACPRVSCWSQDILKDLFPALEAFEVNSQGFLGSAIHHHWAALEYSRRIGLPGQYAERHWDL